VRFRPCIDLHGGRVKQIVGGTLRDDDPASLSTNFESDRPAGYFAALYRDDGLEGGHVIMLGPGNESAAQEALAAFPGGLQVGGGIRAENAPRWIERGAQAVIVTSYVFTEGRIDQSRLDRLTDAVGPDRLVLDLSCRRKGDTYYVVTDRWQRFTSFEITEENLSRLARYAGEFLVHGVDVEGRRMGIEEPLIERLARFSPLPTTYAGGVRNMDDVDAVERIGGGRIDITVGSALDIFGGSGVAYKKMVARDRAARRED